jgi:ABC-2 type transport system permease protein
MGIWTAQSWGPRFCFEIVLEFCAGAYFPIDLLPSTAQRFLSWLPFPYLIFYPLSIYLGRLSGVAVAVCLGRQILWMTVLGFMIRSLWNTGLKVYAAEGR